MWFTCFWCDDRKAYLHLTTMRKDGLLKLAMPASISLLAVAIFFLPFVVKASGSMTVYQGGDWSVQTLRRLNP